MEHDDDAQAAEEVAETGMKQLAISEEKDSQKSSEEEEPLKPSEAGEEKGTKVVDGKKGASTSVSKESGKPTKKPEKSAKSKNEKPRVHLSLYVIYKDESGLHKIDVWKPDKHGNARGCRLVLELFESKSEPKTYLFGLRVYPTPGSSKYIRRFPDNASGDKAPGDNAAGGKEHEISEFRSFFRRRTGVNWQERNSVPSKGPFYYLPPAVSGKKIESASHENKFDELGGERRQITSHVAKPRDPRDHRDRETSFKRKKSFSEEPPVRAFKVTKPSVSSNSAKVTNGGSKTAET